MMICRILAVVLFTLLFAIPAKAKPGLTATRAEAGVSAARWNRVGTIMDRLILSKEIPGAVVMVVRDGRIVFAVARGSQDVESATPMRTDTIFRIYSMTKPVTSLAALMLCEEGKLSLDDPVSKYVPGLSQLKVCTDAEGNCHSTVDAAREITIRDLLRHTSGLSYGFCDSTEVGEQYRNANVLDIHDDLSVTMRKIGSIPLRFQPGTEWNYSVSTDVLGHVIELVSGTSLDEFLAERIFAPLGMSDSGFTVSAEDGHRLATCYDKEPDGDFRAVQGEMNTRFILGANLLSGGGGLVSTARDYLAFCQMLLNGGQLNGVRLVSADTVELMTTDQLPIDHAPLRLDGRRLWGRGYGLGVAVVTTKTRLTRDTPLGEYGWAGRASTSFWVSPRHSMAAVVLTQCVPNTMQLQRAVKPSIYRAVAAEAKAKRTTSVAWRPAEVSSEPSI